MINVCFACGDDYAKFAGVAITSILKNAKYEDSLTFYILDGGISEDNKQKINSLSTIKDCEINFIRIQDDEFQLYKTVKTHDYIKLPTYYRLKLPSLLPNVNRIIYLDCDVIVLTSLSELFNIEMAENIIAGVLDTKKKKVRKIPNYINAGVLLIDLDKMRKFETENAFRDWTKENHKIIKTGDQEIINETCQDKILILEDEWNVQSSNFTNRSSYTHHPKIVHFTGKRKPWHYASFSYHKALFFQYLQMTSWKLSETEFKHWTTDNQKDSIIEYLKYRPLFFLRPKFYKALYKTYFCKKYSQKDIKIIVTYHKKYKLYKNNLLIPIHCGRKIAFDKFQNGEISSDEFNWMKQNLIGDDTFDNISHLNKTLNEMTAIYWVWKNYDKIGNPDYIGINHYRRFFEINYGNLDKILSKYDFIKQQHSKSKYSFYSCWCKSESKTKEFIDNAINICKSINPHEGEMFEKFLKGNITRGFCNMFIMKREDFFKYCETIFPIILALPQEIEFGRQSGYFAELFTSYWLYQLAKRQKAYNTSIVNYFENNEISFIKNKIFSIKKENLSKNAHTIIKCFGIKLKLKY